MDISEHMQLKIQKAYWFLLLIAATIVPTACKKTSGDNCCPIPPPETGFTNPVLSGSDPWIYKNDSIYYYTQTSGNRIMLWKTKAVSKLSTATTKTVFTPAAGTANAANIWAPEIHFFDNKWYIYYTAGSGTDVSQRTWVLENTSADPTTGAWTDKGRIFSAASDFWAIDGTAFEHNGSRYFLWSGRPDPSVQNQNIYISKMINPWTLESTSAVLTKPELSWEQTGGPVNEAPQIIKNSTGNVFLVYSASGCWTDEYSLGLLSLKNGGDPLQPGDWTKSPLPVFVKSAMNNAYGPGHNAFFKSADGKEDWIIYHANNNSNEGCGDKRNIRMQRMNWSAGGLPQFGEPVRTGMKMDLPSGE